MNKLTEQELKEFINALQLSIKTKINDVENTNDEVKIIFDSQPNPLSDENLYKFLDTIDGIWEKEKPIFILHNASKINLPRITMFLLVTRMDTENIFKLAEFDKYAQEIAVKIGLEPANTNLDSVKKCSEAVFQKMEIKQMTIRELAEKTGLTQVSISNFKVGKDIRLSNLLKIIGALEMKLKIK